ncbi:uncharacterized protein TM35_000133240 [Trypanosoma theileri]|uniref:Uncharacterized protein n=1 Tax=Trypanosoma theileri TaxID=67003 RepID=A0A1X0NYT9_9TRYP|nr:uncharacterized protein TM35_000133240 [Trypanosoma theileri]ORC89320.1 hypothetical protein TM35_000133240 [Trypanosoma theileri]
MERSTECCVYHGIHLVNTEDWLGNGRVEYRVPYASLLELPRLYPIMVCHHSLYLLLTVLFDWFCNYFLAADLEYCVWQILSLALIATLRRRLFCAVGILPFVSVWVWCGGVFAWGMR